jgi:4-amino-4-deoxy-L-arabinose transferase-like glycosyltransferase
MLLTTILLLAFFIRVYRTEDLLRFYYDQGRDALVIWKLWHEGKPFLIGPVTGLQGIFLGPFYYYLIAPFYLIGGGNPVYPAVFLAFLSVLALLVLYILGKEMHSRLAGIFAATIGAFSYYIFSHSRWLSNPNPILLSSVLLLYFMWRIVDKNKISNSKGLLLGEWIGVAVFAGISLHFESASAVFYLPTVFLFALWQKKKLPDKRNLMIVFGLFAVTLLPQIIFNFRHDNILVENFQSLFFQERAFRGLTKFIFVERIKYFWGVFLNKLYPSGYKYVAVFAALSLSSLIVKRKKLKNELFELFLLLFAVPAVGYLLFQGNFGNIYDYYLSGYFLPLILFFAIGLAQLWKIGLGKVAVLLFFVSFFKQNYLPIRSYLTATPKTRPIALEDQLNAIDWMFDDMKDEASFNVDVYVPPVIPHAYDYLLLWQGTLRQAQGKPGCGQDLCGKVDKRVPMLYTIYEEDPPHPERLKAWLDRQKGIGNVEEEEKFGQITVQRRKRF